MVTFEETQPAQANSANGLIHVFSNVQKFDAMRTFFKAEALF
jgi:hypothetical protein